ncbi:Alcohol dehydrogenase GroES domain protein [Oceanithermus profundus DSM 14977]|uniref:Alcohol dehydrogenase GroES domain protein n=1 Tax=Oceanithermus profundus (strain DSM 14977 / NBRC 100410 / VKM B-2274 / 506) TaxID=670487 RepID=E4U603_OCEP5|nr:zinc-dependent dehydrogenase [Oceanithermus profundus]ADR35824.1 Alcohol dehydrogenase GroES domain protein [Oceanithermus profundus DSM 14977]
MRVAMYYNNHDVRLEEQPVPEIGPGEVLIKIVASGICGSDVMEWYRIKKAPLVLGHEIAGDIVAVGEGVTGFQPGDRVTATHHVPCGRCEYCQRGQHSLCPLISNTTYDPGGFAEYVRVPAINVETRGVLKLPDSVSYEEGSFTEPLGCVVRGLRVMGFEPARSVLVLGSGLSGQLVIRTARAYGAGKIIATDINDFRLEMARRSGAEVALHATREDVVQRVLEETNGEGVDYVIPTAAAPALFDQAMQTVRKGGTVLLYGIMAPGTKVAFDVFPFWKKQVKLLSTYAAAPRDLAEALELIRARRVPVEDLITHRLPLAETQKGFELTAAGGDSMKVIIEPQR